MYRNAAASRNSTPLALRELVLEWRDRLSEFTCLEFISKLIISLLHNRLLYNNPNTNTLRTTKCCRGYLKPCTIAPSAHVRSDHATLCTIRLAAIKHIICHVTLMGVGAGGLDDSARCRKRGGGRATDPANSGKSSEIRCCNSGLIEDSSLSACDAVSLGRLYSTFRSTGVP